MRIEYKSIKTLLLDPNNARFAELYNEVLKKKIL